MLGSRRSGLITQCVVTTCTAALTAVFCAQYFCAREDSETISECERLRAELENIAVKQSIMKSRIADHFSLLCVLDSIDTKIPEGWFPPANHGTCVTVGAAASAVCKVVLGVAIGSALLLYALKQLFGFGVHTAGISIPDPVVAAIVASFIVLSTLGCCSTVVGERGNSRKRQDRTLRKLTRAYEKSQVHYERIVDSTERYNALPEDVKYNIRTSEYLSALVKEKIVSGTFTEKSAKEIKEKADACYGEEVSICA
ncbi:hypothetical protein ACIS_00552 [Anaplasma centrale str. Israel]|uniref:Uncharacterized protein n=1 Tax=Anaplasma centrale (strain Israel) TaxID=574556 RepID=D1AUD0_ANACI|nr:hypothetical protein [Anaplasma centrale]ACZ49158.1 hypothetical protein ACIS_00552 [Anaplasma centrale str. Israel]